MNNFISKDDYLAMMPAKRRDQASDYDDDILDTVEKFAVQAVRDSLHLKYDVDEIFSQTGNNRHQQVLRWCIVICVYHLYERLPDLQLSSKVQKSYDEVMSLLDEVEDGKKSLELPLKVVDGSVRTKFRWYSQPPRTH